MVSTESTDDSLFPSLAVDSDGNIHVAWYDYTDYGGSDTDVDVFYKAKIGGSWTSTEVVSTESTGDSDYPSLAVDSDGNIHVAWRDYTDYGGAGTDVDVFYKAKIGGSWAFTEVVSTESTGASYHPSLAVDPDGNIHVAWQDDTDYDGSGTDVDVFYKVKIGGSWTSTEVVSTESTDGSSSPSLAVDPDGNIHVAWYDYTDYGGAGTDADVFYKRLDAVISLSDIMEELDDIEAKLDSILEKLGLPPVGGSILPREELSIILNVISENLAAVALILAAVMVYLLLAKRMS